MNLPKKFTDRMKEMLKEEYKDYEESLKQKPYAGIRINTMKLTTKQFETISPFQISPIPWVANGFYYNENIQPAKHPYYYAGMYYIQEPSAMAPAAILPIEEGDKVLDMCAAPGGKSTELAAKLNGTGVLITNDISNSRAKALLKNIELFGVKNAIVMSENPKKLVESFSGYFDKILIDAPCSGEGMFKKEPAMIKNWEEYGVDYYSKIQKELILYGAQMLKTGGYMVYSTCTFSKEENEETIAYLLKEHKEFSIESISYQNGFSEGTLKNCIRLWPHKIQGEGHFVTLLKKNQGDAALLKPFVYSKFKMPETLELFLKNVKLDFDLCRFKQIEDNVYYLPEGLVTMDKLRILRSGLLIGTIKKNRFEPSQAFACALKQEEYKKVISLPAADANVIKYLKGETIEIDGLHEDGYNLICVDGYPLGWGKATGTTLKNKYYSGWRWL